MNHLELSSTGRTRAKASRMIVITATQSSSNRLHLSSQRTREVAVSLITQEVESEVVLKTMLLNMKIKCP